MTLQTALPANSALIPADALRAGTRLEDYEIDCVIARSAVAMVYRALDRRSDQIVAIKEFLPIGLAMRGDDGQVAAREIIHEQNFQRGQQVFREAAKALEKCEHASLMRVLRVLEWHGTVYRVMPYCPGPTLLEYRQKMTAAPTDRLLRTWLESLLGALAQLHQRGQVHGAVSPGNILMLPDDRPLLLDSDAVHAAILSDRTRSMIAALEPCFAPQEQCEPAPARPLGPWTDLYSLAATLRFCISGQLPGTFAQRPRGAWFDSERPRRASAGGAVGDGGLPSLAALDACLADVARDRPQSVTQLSRLLGIERPTSPAAMALATAGLVPSLSSPASRSPASAADPTPPLPVAVAPEAEPEVPVAAQAVPQAAQGVETLPLPLVVSSPAAMVEEAAIPSDCPAPRPEATLPIDAPASAEPAQLKSPAARPTARSRVRLAAAAGSLVLVAIVVASVSLFKAEAPAGPDDAAATTAAPSSVQPVQPSAVSDAVPIKTRQPIAQPDSAPAGKADARAAPAPARAAAPYPPQGKSASTKAKGKPVAAKEQSKAVAAKSPALAASPRQACAGRERYALLQCMETQCAKKAWTKHEQCMRLRKDRKL